MAIKINRSRKRVVSARPASKKTTGSRPGKFGKKTTSKVFDEQKRKSGITGFAGAEGFRQAKKEKEISEENRRKRQIPWRLWLPPGSEADVILLDKKPFFMYEHQYKGRDGKPAFERCIKDTGHCPLCSKLNREGYFVMMLTCIDLRGYKKKDGKRVRASRKLFPVKQSQMNKYERMYLKNKESFRGLKLHLTRDGERDATIGNDVELVETLNEVKLAKYGEELTTAVNYNEAFPALSEKVMADRYETGKALGSTEFDKDDDDDDPDDDEKW